MKHLMWVIVTIVTACAQQQPPPQADMSIDAKTRAAVIDGVIEKLSRAYVFPDVAEKMGAAVRERRTKGEYDRITSSIELAKTLTDHLRAVSHVKHLHVDYSMTSSACLRPESRSGSGP